MINKLNILGVEFTIIEVPVVNKDEPRKGEINYLTNEIRIDESMPLSLKNQTLMHEILHAVFLNDRPKMVGRSTKVEKGRCSMTYESVLDTAFKELPEFKNEYDDFVSKDIIDNNSGMHIVFSYVFVPMVEKNIKANDKRKLRKICDFLEKMAASNDEEVQAICDQSILEVLCGEYQDKILIPLFGEKTLEGLYSVRQYILEP